MVKSALDHCESSPGDVAEIKVTFNSTAQRESALPHLASHIEPPAWRLFWFEGERPSASGQPQKVSLRNRHP